MSIDFYDQAYRRIFNRIPHVLPEHNFVWNSRAHEWWSNTYLNGIPHKRKDKTIITEKVKGVIMEHGGEALSIFNYLTKYRQMSKQDVMHLLAKESGQSLDSEKDSDSKKKSIPKKLTINKTTHLESCEKKKEFIPNRYMEATWKRGYRHCNFIKYLYTLFPTDRLEQIIIRYRLGISKRGNIIFWQLNEKTQVLAGKEMGYRADGHRTKFISFLNKKLGLKTNQCLFGLHLLYEFPHYPIGIVESEKTAIVASEYQPDILWMATGGSNNLSEDKLKALNGRKIILFPDVGKYDEWDNKAQDIQTKNPQINIITSDVLEKRGYDENMDLADIYSKYPKYERPIINHPVYINFEKINPAIKKLVELFDLTPIED